jgi:hypothetical protein
MRTAIVSDHALIGPGVARPGLEQIADPVLDDLIGWNADRILGPLGFEILVDIGIGKGCVRPEIDT